MSRVRTNIAYNFAYQLLILLLPLVTAPYLARVVGAEGVGVYSYSYAVATYFVYFIMLGLNNYGNRTIAACQDDRIERSRAFWSIYAMQVACFAVSGGCYLGYSLLFAGDATVALLQGLYVLSALFDINWFFFGMERFRLTVVRNTVVKVATTVLIFVFVRDAGDVNVYVGIMCGGFLVSQLALWPFLRRFVDFYLPKLSEVVPHLRPNAILFVSVIAISVYNVLSKIMLGSMAGAEAVGFFESAAKIAAVPVALVGAVGTVMLPRTSALIAKGEADRAGSHTDKTLRAVMAFTSLAAFGIPAVASPFTQVFYGPGFEESARVLAILAATVPLLGFGNVLRTQYLIPNARDSVFLWSAVCGAAASVALNLLLIPDFGAVGSAFASVGAESAVLIYQVARVKGEVPLARYLVYAAVFLAIGFVMGAVLVFMPSAGNPLGDVVFRVLAGLIVYLPLAFLAERALGRHDGESARKGMVR